MFKKSKGFTLIELLIVVAIIGILAALLIPNAMSALQKAKQKGTMKDIMTIATALTDYVTDNGVAPVVGAQVASQTDAIVGLLSPFYIQVMPTKDQWGYGFWIFGRAACTGQWGVAYADGSVIGNTEFVVASVGRDGAYLGGDAHIYDPTDREKGFYTVTSMKSFDEDLVVWNGAWVVGPIKRATI